MPNSPSSSKNGPKSTRPIRATQWAPGLTRIGEDVELTVDRKGAERKVAVHVDPAGPSSPQKPPRQR